MVFNYSKLRGKIREVYGTESAFAVALGMGRVSLSQRLNNAAEFSLPGDPSILSAARNSVQ